MPRFRGEDRQSDIERLSVARGFIASRDKRWQTTNQGGD